MGPTPDPVLAGQAADVVADLEERIVDVERAAADEEGGTTEDTVGSVPGAPEPPD